MPRAKRKKPEVEAPVVEAEAKKEEVAPVVKPEVEAPVVEAEEFDPDADYVVSDGHYIACRKGILKPGEPVEPKDFGGGVRALSDHWNNGGLEKA